jgi:hypothetical protein
VNLSETSDKAALSVSEVAALCQLSRSRFHALVQAGVFPRPALHPSSKRPFYHREAVQICVEIRRTGIGLTGQIVLFNRKPKRNEQPKPLRKPAEERQPAHDELVDALKGLGLTTTAQAVNEAVAALYPDGLVGSEPGDVVRKLFLHLQGRRT